jgi:hypothetical protein
MNRFSLGECVKHNTQSLTIHSHTENNTHTHKSLTKLAVVEWLGIWCPHWGSPALTQLLISANRKYYRLKIDTYIINKLFK